MGRHCRTVLILVALAAAAPIGAAEDGFASLFDGKSLEGWVPEHSDRFRVRDGVLSQDGGTGWLRSAKAYKDFEFRAEYRAVKKGADSGLFFRASVASTPQPPHWPAKGYQLQIIDNAESHLKIFGHGTAPPTYDRQAEDLNKGLRGPGEWQNLVLKVVGSRAEVWLNGARITISDSIGLPQGYLGIQGENGQFEWRNLRIRSL